MLVCAYVILSDLQSCQQTHISHADKYLNCYIFNYILNKAFFTIYKLQPYRRGHKQNLIKFAVSNLCSKKLILYKIQTLLVT